MKSLFPYFRAENYRRMSEGNAPNDAKAHESGVLPVGASLEDAAMVKPAVCPIASTYNLTFPEHRILITINMVFCIDSHVYSIFQIENIDS